ncbi:hypothetical protein H3C61_04350 [Candidatus Gracilibacteria bacterium]|nr:hypothetical protein [Candidatus Gracilibacteria bacterium]
MKKFLLIFISTLLFNTSILYADFNQCDQIFDGGMLRYDYSYKFHDDWNNNTNKNVYLNDSRVDFESPTYLDQGTKFDWTQALRNNNYTVNPNSSMRILETGTTNWRIANHPTTRTAGTRNSHDFGISYTVYYDYSNNYPNASDDISHKECIYYSVSWCGDGVLDNNLDYSGRPYEVCDSNDPNKTGWGPGGCSNTCQPIITPAPICNNLTISPNSGNSPLTSSFNCNATNATSYRIDIMNSLGNIINTINNSTGTYTFSSTGSYSARCSINGNITSNSCLGNISVNPPVIPPPSSSSSGGGSSSSSSSSSSSGGGSSGGSSSGGGNYCGDGVLQRPNNSGQMEQCDFGTNTANWPAWCVRSTCSINENTKPGGGTDTNNTQPGGGSILFTPGNTLVLGGNMGVFEYLSSNFATIKNNSTSDIYIDKPLCVYKSGFSYNSLVGNNICSSNNIGLLSKNGGAVRLNIGDRQFYSDITSLPNGVNYVDGNIITTLQGLQNNDTFLKSILKVRVAKPSVSTTGGGAGKVNGTNLSDVNQLSNNFGDLDPNKNKNIIGTSVGNNSLSTSTKKITNNTDVNKSTSKENKNLSSLDKTFTSGDNTTLNSLPTTKYNGFDNIFTHKGNLSLSSQTISGGNKTYIIEDGDLTISGDIKSDKNILFVIKNGKVIITKDVKLIDAVIINLNGGSIVGDEQTTNKLIVNGALYGNVDNLLSKRTYIKDRGEYIDVGTNINFTSKIISSPPPLLSKFLGEYIEGTKAPK